MWGLLTTKPLNGLNVLMYIGLDINDHIELIMLESFKGQSAVATSVFGLMS